MSGEFETIQVRTDGAIHFIQINRPDANNAINDRLVEELAAALDACERDANVVVLEGLPGVFCSGADFNEIQSRFDNSELGEQNPEPLYDLWYRLASGPFISIAHVRGRANAGGIGFVAASDVVLAEEKAMFSLSELLFGLMPACVMPFLIRRMGFAKANYLTLMTQPIQARRAMDWGLVDACEENSEQAVRKHLLRLRHLGKNGIARYKRYASSLDDSLRTAKPKALDANAEVFSDAENVRAIARYVKTGKFPWETD